MYDQIMCRFTDFFNLLVVSRKFYNYNWLIFSKKTFKFFKKKLNFFFFKNSFFLKKKTTHINVKSIVWFKKKTSMLKKKNKIQMAFIRRLNLFRFKKNKINPSYRGRRFKPLYSSKFIDLHKRTNQIWFTNRYLFRDFFSLNKFRQWSLTRVFSGLVKADPDTFLNSLESTLQYVLIFSKLAFTFKESKFLINSGLVFINGEACLYELALVHPGDVIQLGLSDKFFKFYRMNVHLRTRVFKKISYTLWLINRFRNNFYKQSRNRIPSWINNLLFVHEDVPVYMEVDYSILTIGIIFKKTKFNHFNFFTKKTISLFLLRHYNWNYIN